MEIASEENVLFWVSLHCFLFQRNMAEVSKFRKSFFSVPFCSLAFQTLYNVTVVTTMLRAQSSRNIAYFSLLIVVD